MAPKTEFATRNKMKSVTQNERPEQISLNASIEG